MKRFAFFLLLFSIISNSFCIPLSQKADSLEKILAAHLSRKGPDTTAINILFDIYYERRKGDPLKANEYLQQALNIARELNDKRKTGLILYHKGYLYRTLGINNLAIQSYIKALKIYEELNDTNLAAWLLIDMGNLYYSQKPKLLIALEHFQKAEHMFRELGNEIGMIVALQNIGLTYKHLAKYPNAVEHLLKAADLSRDIKDRNNEALTLSYIGQVYMLQKNYSKALHYLNQSFNINKALDDNWGLAYSYDNYASLYQAQNMYPQAIQNSLDALLFYEAIDDKSAIAYLNEKISTLYSERKENAKAIHYALRSLQVADSNNLIGQQQNALHRIAGYYSSLKDYENAYKYFKRYMDLKESNINKNLDQLQTEYELEVKHHEKKMLEGEKALRDAKIRQQNIVIYLSAGGLLLVLVLSVSLYMKVRQLQASNLHLFRSNVEIVKKEKELQEIKESGKYSKSPLSDQHNQNLLSNLNELINNEKIYLNNKLTVEELAKKLNTNRTYLSQVINENFNTNFSNYINEYRIKEAQRILLDAKSKVLTIEGIAQTVGFSSKSSFNTSFKKITGLTPSEFIRLKGQQEAASSNEA